MNKHESIIAALVLTVWMTFAAPTASAQGDDYDTFGFSVGLFVTALDTKTRLDSSSGDSGTEFDFEDDLGLESADAIFRLDGYYRFAEKHQLNFSWFDLSRSGTAQLQGEIDYGDSTFPIDTVVDSDNELQIYRIAYTWRFVQRDNGFLGATVGLYVADFDASMRAETIDAVESDGTTAPLPVIGLRGEYSFSEKWSFHADAEFFSLNFDDFDGSLYDVYAGIDYGISDRTSIGIGINSVGADIDATGSDYAGKLVWKYTGALVFLKFDF